MTHNNAVRSASLQPSPVSVCVCQLRDDFCEAHFSCGSEGVGAIVCGGGGVRPTLQQLAHKVTARGAHHRSEQTHSTAQHTH
jgi:hypothetical protein